MKRSPLHDVHIELGAVMSEAGGWEMPAHYGDPQAECRAVREAIGLLDCSHRAKLRATGKDRANFLNSMVTNDIAGLQIGQGTYAAMVTDKGKMVSDFRIYIFPDHLLLEGDAETREAAYQGLEKYNLGYDCTLEDQTEEWGLLSLRGQGAAALAGAVLGETLELGPPYRCREGSFSGQKILLAHGPTLGEEALDLFFPAPGLRDLWEALRREGGDRLRPVGLSALEILRIEAGVPRFGVDMDSNVNPMEAGLLSAISFTKGCYIGQEVIAKIDSLGHVNKNLVGLWVEGDTPPAAGSVILGEGKKTGHITSAVRSPTLGRVIAMGYVHRRFKEPGQAVEVELDGRHEKAEVAKTPFYRRAAR